MRGLYFWRGIGISLLIVGIFLYSFILHIGEPLSLIHNDAFQTQFILKHYADVVKTGNWKSITNLPMLYGYPDALLLNEHFIVQAVIAVPIYLLSGNVNLMYSVTAIAVLIFSFWAMYLLALHVTHNVWAAIVSSIVYVLNPFVFARFPDHLNLVTLGFIPLIILFIEKSFEKPTAKRVFLVFLFITFQILCSWYYAAFLTVVLPIYIVIRLYQRRSAILPYINRGLIAGVILLGLVSFGTWKLYTPLLNGYKENSQQEQLFYTVFAAWPTDWLFTAPNNVIYGQVRQTVASKYPNLVHKGNASEENLFWGIVPLILFLLSFSIVRQSKKYRSIWIVETILLVLSFLLSFGPVIRFTSTVSIPNIYNFFERIDPILSFTRVTARWAVFVFFFLALIVGETVEVLVNNKRVKKAWAVGALVVVAILLDYWNSPMTFMTIGQSTVQFYNKVKNDAAIHVLLDLPIGNKLPAGSSGARAEYLDAHYMFWASSLHGKALFNGYTAFMPLTYYEVADELSTAPLTSESVSWLASNGIDAIVLHRDEYPYQGDYFTQRATLRLLKVPMKYSTDSLALFDITSYKGK